MSIFYITTETGLVYELSTTTDVRLEERGRATDHPVESGRVVSDNIIIDPIVVTFDGLITDIAVSTQLSDRRRTPEDFIEEIRDLRNAKGLVSVTLGDRLNPIQNCAIELANYTKTKVEGKRAWRASLKFKQIIIPEQAQLTEVKELDPSVVNSSTAKEISSNNSTSEVKETKKSTILRTSVIEGVSVFDALTQGKANGS